MYPLISKDSSRLCLINLYTQLLIYLNIISFGFKLRDKLSINILKLSVT